MEVPEAYAGSVIEKLGSRHGEMKDMRLEGGAFLFGQRQGGLGAFGEFFVDERVGASQLVFDLAWTERIPPLQGDPVRVCRVGRGTNSIDLQ